MSDEVKDEAVSLAFELAKFGIQRFMGRQLRRDEEDQLLQHLREKESSRHIKTSSEILDELEGHEE